MPGEQPSASDGWELEDNYSSFLALLVILRGMFHIISEFLMGQDFIAHRRKLLNMYSLFSSSSLLSHFHSFISVPWDYLPNELLVLESLSQSLLQGPPKVLLTLEISHY